MDDLNRQVQHSRLVEAFRLQMETRDFREMIETCKNIYQISPEDDLTWNCLSVVWNNWEPLGGFSTAMQRKQKEFLTSVQKEKPAKCIEFMLQDIKQSRFNRAFEYLHNIITLPPYCHSSYLNGYYAMMCYFAFAIQNGSDSLAKTGQKHFLLSKHCDFVFDYFYCELLCCLGRKDEAVDFAIESVEKYHQNNFYLLRFLYDNSNASDYFAEKLILLPVVVTDLRVLNSLNPVDKMKYLLRLIFENYLNEKLWLILNETIEGLDEDETARFMDEFNWDFITESLVEIQKRANIPAANQSINLIQRKFKWSGVDAKSK